MQNPNRRQLILGAAGGLLATQFPASAFARPGPPPGLIQLSSNENPYGPSQKARAAAHEAADAGAYYSFPMQAELKGVIAKDLDLTSDHVALATGSNEALCAACQAWGWPGPIIAPALTYSAHLSYGRRLGMEITEVPLTESMMIDLDGMASAVKPDTKLIYLCNPNNPTGSLIDGTTMRAFCETLSRKAVVLVDEAYIELTDDPASHSVLPLIQAGHDVIVTRTFSKLFGMAGMRMGYALGRPELIGELKQHVMSWVNSVAVAAAIASYQDTAFIEFSKEKIREGRNIVSDAFRERGLQSLPSHTNFVYTHIHRDAGELRQAMREQGVLVGSPYRGYPDWMRVSMGRTEDLQQFARVLEKTW